jgi:ATP adenylyltransferase
MDRLWTPWRYDYITGAARTPRKGVPAALEAWPADRDRHCVFCNMIAAVDYAVEQGMEREAAEKAVHLVSRGEHTFVCLNAYPYGTGHAMVIPYEHLDSLAAMSDAAAEEMMTTARRIETALREVYRPDGVNLGMNMGQAAGAGIAEHVHLHMLPRWLGDTNFMTAIADTRVLPETLDLTWARLRKALQGPDAGSSGRTP